MILVSVCWTRRPGYPRAGGRIYYFIIVKFKIISTPRARGSLGQSAWERMRRGYDDFHIYYITNNMGINQ